MEKDLVSTGQAAKLCAVTPDTILKWIKKNRIEAIKTAGGHYRISKDKLQPYLVQKEESTEVVLQKINYCWEYHSQDEELNDSCRECIIFASRAEKCFQMAGIKQRDNFPQTFCKSSCHDCEYFHFINTTNANVLIITENELLKNKIKESSQKGMTVRFSCCGYETSSLIQDFHPDYIIIDESLVNSNSDELCRHLIDDPRVHGSQIILAVTDEKNLHKLPEGVCASIRVPFYSSDLEECFINLQNIFWGSSENVKGLERDTFADYK